jgi:hypothetical protein
MRQNLYVKIYLSQTSDEPNVNYGQMKVKIKLFYSKSGILGFGSAVGRYGSTYIYINKLRGL